MTHFAKVKDGIVIRVIRAEAEFFDTYVDDEPGEWIPTSYDGSIRKNYAGIGFTYDKDRDAFIPPKPFDSWTLNETTCQWEAPVVKPDDDNFYVWNEETKQWDLVN